MIILLEFYFDNKYVTNYLQKLFISVIYNIIVALIIHKCNINIKILHINHMLYIICVTLLFCNMIISYRGNAHIVSI